MSQDAVDQFIQTLQSIAAEHESVPDTLDALESILPFTRSTCESILRDLGTKSDDPNPNEITEEKESDALWSEMELDDIERHFSSHSEEQIVSESTSTLKLDPNLSFQIVYVSGNPGKLKELQNFLGDAMARHFTFYDIDLDEIQGDEVEVVTDKVQRAKRQIERVLDAESRCLLDRSSVYVLVEDTSLYLSKYSVNFHFPGPFVKVSSMTS